MGKWEKWEKLFSYIIVEMPRGRPRGTRNTSKKSYAPNRNTYNKYKSRLAKRGNLVRLIKKISLGQHETKSVHNINQNVNINHNQGYIYTNLLKTQQGITDTDTGASAYANRLGDEVQARGISIKLWIANKLDRPNVMYRMGIFKYQASSIPTLSQLFVGANPNRIMDKLDNEYITIVYQKVFNLQVGYSASTTGTPLLPASTDVGREAHTYRKIWLNLKNKKIIYNNGGTTPKFIDYGFFIVPYDSFGTSTSDNISSFAYEQEFYFKDA